MKIGTAFKIMATSAQEITAPVCAIIRFHDGAVNPAILYQVVLDPKNLSPNGLNMRFTQSDHCEVHGWKMLESIELVEVLEAEQPPAVTTTAGYASP